MILDRFRLDGRVVIVTGAGRGIGRGIAEAFAEVGAHIVCAARTPAQLDEVAAAIRGHGARALTLPCDVNDRTQLEAVVARTMAEFGRVDVLVNNAGGSPPSGALRTSERMFEEALRFNLTSAFLLSRLVIPHMLERDGGVILNVSSALSHMVEKGFVAYGTAKAALNHMTRLLAFEMAPRVRVNAIAVGAVETTALAPFLAASPELREKMEAMTPMRRVGTTDDIAAAALYLCSPAASWVTGKVFEVDGGTVASNWPIDMSGM